MIEPSLPQSSPNLIRLSANGGELPFITRIPTLSKNTMTPYKLQRVFVRPSYSTVMVMIASLGATMVAGTPLRIV